MSNFPLSYKLSWLPRLLKPSLAGSREGFAPAAATLITPARTVRLAFVGDISAVANPEAPECDAAIVALLASADLVVGNCESPVVERPHAMLGTRLGTRHAMTERFLSEALERCGVAREKLVLSLANNHALDQGIAGFDETLAALRRLGIRAIGLADEPVAKVVVGGALGIGFTAFTLWRNDGKASFSGRVSMAAGTQHGPPRAKDGIDLLCALPHWGWEFRHFPRPETRALARRLAGQGVGLLVGGHAHIVQPIERIDGSTLAAYGLGDFLGTALARVPWPARIGAILIVEVSADEGTRGTIAGWRLNFFVRVREGGHERLVPVETLIEPLREKAAARLEAVYGGRVPNAAPK